MRLSSFHLRKVGPYRRVPWCVPARRLCRSPQDCVCGLRSYGRAPITRTDARKDTHSLTRRYPVTRHVRTHKLTNPHTRGQMHGHSTLRCSGGKDIIVISPVEPVASESCLPSMPSLRPFARHYLCAGPAEEQPYTGCDPRFLLLHRHLLAEL